MTSDIIRRKSRGSGALGQVTFGPITGRTSLPLRVAVYSEIARAIRAGELGPGEVLPREPDLCAAFEVSRTVMREALILLEEDGLVRTARGIGRFVADVLPAIGLEQLQSIEAMLERQGRRVGVERLRSEDEELTDFTRRGLALEDPARARMWESVVTHDGDPIALVQEWVAAGGDVDAAIAAHTDRPVSLLAALIEIYGSALGPATCEVTVSNAGSERAHPLGVAGSAPVLLLFHTVPAGGDPLYVGKHLIRPEAGHLTVAQSSQP
jgi:GntR family transcriptional regulator